MQTMMIIKLLLCAICYMHCTAIHMGFLLHAMHCLYVLYAIQMGVAAMCYNHFLVSAICYVLLNGLCYMLLETPWGPICCMCL